MHEMGIAMQIVEIAGEAIPPGIENPSVAKVNIRVGKLTAVVPTSLTFCFNIATQDTPLAGAELAIEEVPVVARCKQCGHEWIISGPDFSCEKCRAGEVDILSGRELDIVSIELKE